MNIKLQFLPKRLKLKEWAQVESIMKSIQFYVNRGGYEPVAPLITQVLNICGKRGKFKRQPWYKTDELFTVAQFMNRPRVDLPMLKTKEKGDNIPWDYIGRDWAWWVNLFASKYGWAEDKIAKMDVDEALALYQEMQVDEQLEKEWVYGLSELAYEYVPSTKKSKFRPLPRPDWMLVTKENYKPKEPKKVKIRRDMMPVGKVINLDEKDSHEDNTQNAQ